MTKSIISSIAFIALAAGLSTAPVQAEEFNSSSAVKVEKASYAVYGRNKIGIGGRNHWNPHSADPWANAPSTQTLTR